ncbi:MAG: 2OG-Fe(II) oxygenase [Xanthomonadales bacterium PRO7]|nr:2OG-Fe(II) oxygenase [Xanthomonadales bacterium PRO7]
MPYVFDLDTLTRLAEIRQGEFAGADPYPHLIMDDFLRTDRAEELARLFPRPDDAIAWDRFNIQTVEMKLGSSHEERFPAPHRQALHDLNSGPFLSFLERLSGIEHLLPDPHLAGGGLHLSRLGDHLGIHADFNWHPQLEAHRRLNLLVYLTPHWQSGFGGELELWDTTGTRKVRTVEPVFNRAVLFVTRSDTFHGHPVPWAAPEGTYRQSLALYYYTTNRPEHERRPAHSTLYKGHNV